MRPIFPKGKSPIGLSPLHPIYSDAMVCHPNDSHGGEGLEISTHVRVCLLLLFCQIDWNIPNECRSLLYYNPISGHHKGGEVIYLLQKRGQVLGLYLVLVCDKYLIQSCPNMGLWVQVCDTDIHKNTSSSVNLTHINRSPWRTLPLVLHCSHPSAPYTKSDYGVTCIYGDLLSSPPPPGWNVCVCVCVCVYVCMCVCV